MRYSGRGTVGVSVTSRLRKVKKSRPWMDAEGSQEMAVEWECKHKSSIPRPSRIRLIATPTIRTRLTQFSSFVSPLPDIPLFTTM
jgi:hypothetical protein